MRHVIHGPPGTGKTTKLLEKMDQALNDGVQPHQIGFFSFTKKASTEGVSRACEKFGYDPVDFPWFRTLHSLAFRQLGLKTSQVFSGKQIQEFADEHNLDLGDGVRSEDQQAFNLQELARVKGVGFHEVGDDDVNTRHVDWMAERVKEYKEEHGLLDFCDMIQMLKKEPRMLPTLKVLIVDEAQDMSAPLWDLVFMLETKAEVTYIAGDDDQAIYTWNGADVDTFIAISEGAEVLRKSYRLPRAVFNEAVKISSKISKRVHKEWYPKDSEGRVDFIESLDETEINQGPWLILGRNICHLHNYREELMDMGVYFSVMGKPSVQESITRAVITWTALSKGGFVDSNAVENCMKYYEATVGVPPNTVVSMENLGISDDRPWFDALTKIPLNTKYYIRDMLRNGEDFKKPPRVKLSTIHAIKGGECQNVIVLSDMTRKTWENMEVDPDSEWRVLYVGMTRSSDTTLVLAPKTRRYYEF